MLFVGYFYHSLLVHNWFLVPCILSIHFILLYVIRTCIPVQSFPRLLLDKGETMLVVQTSCMYHSIPCQVIVGQRDGTGYYRLTLTNGHWHTNERRHFRHQLSGTTEIRSVSSRRQDHTWGFALPFGFLSAVAQRYWRLLRRLVVPVLGSDNLGCPGWL